MTGAWGIGLPVPASVIRPLMILAGSSAIVTGFESDVPSVSIETRCRANRGSSMLRMTRRSRPAPWMVNRPSASLTAGVGQAGRLLLVFHQNEGPSTVSSRWLARFAGTSRPIVWTTDRDALGRTAIHVEQAPLDHLLGSERDVNVGLVGVGVELDPAGTIARRKSDGAGLVMSGRHGAHGHQSETGPSRRYVPGRSPMVSSSHTRRRAPAV